jgi:hypothetical protein
MSRLSVIRPSMVKVHALGLTFTGLSCELRFNEFAEAVRQFG